jgi:hypothetical protein
MQQSGSMKCVQERRTTVKLLLTLLAVFAFAAAGADISGNWKGSAETPNGTIERTFTFKVDGGKVTGETTSQFLGKSAITDGKLEGDNLTFSITVNFQGNEMKVNYKGKVNPAGTEIKFTAESQGGEFTVEYIAKKTS